MPKTESKQITFNTFINNTKLFKQNVTAELILTLQTLNKIKKTKEDRKNLSDLKNNFYVYFTTRLRKLRITGKNTLGQVTVE
jgi:hypothetical protein